MARRDDEEDFTYDSGGGDGTPYEDEQWGPTTGWRWDEKKDQSNRSAPMGMKWRWMGLPTDGSRRMNNDYGWQLVSNVAPGSQIDANGNITPGPAANTTPPPVVTPPPGGGGGGGYGGGGGTPGYTSAGAFGGLQLPPWVDTYGDYAPGVWQEPAPFTYADWEAPDPTKVTDDPAFQFRMNEGLKPIQNARAMMGLSGSGGSTMKALSNYASGFASNEYDRIYNRAADTYDRGYGAAKDIYKTNRDNAFEAFDLNEDNRASAFRNNKDDAFKGWTLNNGRLKDIWDADWDAYKFQNDDAFRYWQTATNAAASGSQFPG